MDISAREVNEKKFALFLYSFAKAYELRDGHGLSYGPMQMPRNNSRRRECVSALLDGSSVEVRLCSRNTSRRAYTDVDTSGRVVQRSVDYTLHQGLTNKQ